MKNCDNKNKKILRKDKLFLRNSFVILSPKDREEFYGKENMESSPGLDGTGGRDG